MPLVLLPLSESHLEALGTIAGVAFREANGSNNRFLYASAPTPESRQVLVEQATKNFHELRNIVFLGIFDIPEGTPTPQTSEDVSPSCLIAGARMRLEDAQTFAEPQHKRTPPPNANAAAFSAFFEKLNASRRERMGPRTYWNLDLLVTATAYQGRGAGRMLLSWLIERAAKTPDPESGEMGVECFLEATEMGKRVYEYMGFEHQGVLHWSGSDYGIEYDADLWVMIRPAERRGEVNGV